MFNVFTTGSAAVRVDRDRSGPVGLHPAPVARVEHGRRQREHVVEVRLEQVPDRHVLAVVDAARDLVAAFQPRVREPVPSLRGRRRHHQVAAQETDRVLGTALLVPGIRVAEPRLETVVRAEQREQPRLGDGPVGPAVADPGGVVEHQHAGDHAGMGEHLVQAMAHAFRGLSRQRGHVSHVRVRERDHQEMHGPFHAGDHGQGLAEIDLRAARRPFQLTEPLGLAAVALAPALDPSLHRRITALEAAFLHEPLVHAPGGVPLFARHAPVGLEPFVGLARVLARDQGTARSSPGRRNGRIIAGRVLDHGRPRNAQFPGYLRMRQAVRLEPPDTLLNTHRCRHSFPPEDHVLVVSTRESIRNRTAPALFFRRCHFRPPSVSNMNAYAVQIWW